MKKLHKLSFVSVLYNHEEPIVKRMIDSIENVMQYCPYFEYEIVLSNNGKEPYNNLNYQVFDNGKNLGYCKGNNVTIDRTTGDYIFVINPDIVILDSMCLDWMVGRSKLHNSISGRLIGDSRYYVYASSFPTDKKYNPDNLPYYFDQHTLTMPSWKAFRYIDGSLMCFSKKLWEDVGGFDDTFPGYFGENIFAFKAFLAGYSIHDANIDKLFHHAQEQRDQVALTKIKEWSRDGRKYFYEKYALPNWDKFLEYLG